MNTIRLTYSPHGYGKVLRVVPPKLDGEDDTMGDEARTSSIEKSEEYIFLADDDEI